MAEPRGSNFLISRSLLSPEETELTITPGRGLSFNGTLPPDSDLDPRRGEPSNERTDELNAFEKGESRSVRKKTGNVHTHATIMPMFTSIILFRIGVSMGFGCWGYGKVVGMG
jgi:hypothetical protein